MSRSARRGWGARAGSALVVLGCLGVLGAVFTAGVYTGRYWAAPGPGRPSGEVVRAPRVPQLTFYEELTAPLTPVPVAIPATRPAPAATPDRRPAPEPSAERRVPAERTEVPPARSREAGLDARPERRASEPVPRRADLAPARYTVQVAAYSARASAETLRATIAAAGYEAYVAEADGPPGTPRYRVRVGSFPTREAAIAAASRLPVSGARYVVAR